MSKKETAIITGAGPGPGASLGRIFAAAGIRVAVCARSADKLAGLIDEVSAAAGEAKAYACDATNEANVAHVVIDDLIPGEKHSADKKGGNEDALLHPDDIAKSYLTLHHQPKNSWTPELNLRPSVEQF